MNEKITLEVCNNNEWIRVFGPLSGLEIPDADEQFAAQDFISTLCRRLDRAGYEFEYAKGQRTLCHGWNGYQGFTHNLGPVGTFADLTPEQVEEVETLVNEATAEIEARYAGEVQ